MADLSSLNEYEYENENGMRKSETGLLPICLNKSLQSLGMIPASVVESCLPIIV